MPPYGSFQNRNIWPPTHAKHPVYLPRLSNFLKWSPSVFLIMGVCDGLYLSLSGLIAEQQMQILACFSKLFSKKNCSLCTISHLIAQMGKKILSQVLLSQIACRAAHAITVISTETLCSNPVSQSEIMIAAAHIHHTYPCGPVLHATVK